MFGSVLLLLGLWLLPSVLVAAGGVADDTGNLDSNWCRVDPSWSRPFLVALLADPQIGWNLHEYNSEKLFREAATHVKRLQPDIVLVAGDLIQTPGDGDQYRIAKSILDSMDIPHYAIPGNHDVGDTPTRKRMDEFMEWWDLPYYWYKVSHFNTLFVLMDSNVLRKRDDSDVDSEIVDLAREELDWLSITLQSPNYQHIVPIAHHPLAIKTLTEGDKSQNMPRTVRKDLVELFEEHPETVSHVLAGHFHDSARIERNSIKYITYPATGVILGGSPREPSGFALLQVNGDSFQEEYFGYDDMPESRPEASNPGFEIASPQNGEDWIAGRPVCIEWASTSMADQVQIEYSLDAGDTWTSAGTAPNNGVHPWTVPSVQSNRVQIKVSSVHDPTIYGITPTTFQIVPSAPAPTPKPTRRIR